MIHSSNNGDRLDNLVHWGLNGAFKCCSVAATFKEAADLLSVSERTIRWFVNQVGVPVGKISRTKWIAVKDLGQLIEDKKDWRTHTRADPEIMKNFDELLGIRKRPKK